MVPILAALWLGSGCKAELPQQLANDASGDFPCTTFADLLISYSPPGTEGGSALGERALGPPNNESVELLTDAVLSVGFVGLGSVTDQNGSEIRVHGELSAGTEIAVYVASIDGDFVYSGSLVPGQMDVDLSVGTARVASSIQLVGLTGQGTIDAFEALQTSCPQSANLAQ
jgi:hypothetical protein